MKVLVAALLLLASLEEARRAASLRPKHPRLQYELAVAAATEGSHGEALAALERLASWGLVYKPQLAALESSPRYQKVLERFAENAKPMGSPELAFTLDETKLIAEGLAYDGKRFFLSSVREKKIFVIDRNGRSSVFADSLEWGVFGLAVDRKHGLLWAASSEYPGESGNAALLKLDLRSGKLLARLFAGEGKHLFGDVTVASNGEVFVTDSISPIVYHVKDDELMPFVKWGFRSLQGIAATDRILYVSDYGNGLLAIDRKTRDVVPLPIPDDASLLGVDGIYLADDRTIIAVQNGTSPARILRLTLTPNGLGISAVKTLAANLPAMPDPTLGTFAGGAFHFIGNAGWDEKAPPEPVRVLRIRP